MNTVSPMAFLLLVLSVLQACGDDAPAANAPEDHAADYTYESRGEVRHVTAGPPVEIGIRHENIPSFVDREGEVVGMESMMMQFQAKEGLATGSLVPGTPIEFTFEVRWSGPPMLLVTEVTPLAAGTELHLD